MQKFASQDKEVGLYYRKPVTASRPVIMCFYLLLRVLWFLGRA